MSIAQQIFKNLLQESGPATKVLEACTRKGPETRPTRA
jgi:hypothetical protein